MRQNQLIAGRVVSGQVGVFVPTTPSSVDVTPAIGGVGESARVAADARTALNVGF